jgi:hypothetical protein
MKAWPCKKETGFTNRQQEIVQSACNEHTVVLSEMTKDTAEYMLNWLSNMRDDLENESTRNCKTTNQRRFAGRQHRKMIRSLRQKLIIRIQLIKVDAILDRPWPSLRPPERLA